MSGASVAFFRIAFGVAMLVNTFLYLPSLVHEYYVAPSFHFAYGPLSFVTPLPGPGMYLVYVAMGAAGVLIAIGLWYRWAAAAFFVLTTYVFLLDSTFFQNHEYLISLLSFLLVFLPANRLWSVDARRRPALASKTVPAWVVWLLRFQIGVPYFFGGLAKLNADWLEGEPLRMWLAQRTDVELIGPLFAEEPVVLFMAYGALVFDLTVVGLLLYRPTRLPALAVATAFHLTNARLFGLFIFPWLMIAATTIFLAPDWPLRVGAWTRARAARWRRGAPSTAPSPAPKPGDAARALRNPPRMAAGLVACLAAWAAVQVALPLRHFAIPSSPSWSEEGHRFAWHMRLRDKQGTARFVLTANGRSWRVYPSRYLGRKQVSRLAGHPERLVRFARHLSALHGGAEVRVETSVSLNGRRRAPIVDPAVDLASVPVSWRGHAEWILPLEEPLRRE